MTSDAQSNILERLTSAWNIPLQERPKDAPPVRLYRDRTVPAAVIYEALLREFRGADISVAIADFLASIAGKYERDAVPDQDELFLADCCIQLILQVDRLRVEKELIERIVRVFPTLGWDYHVGLLVARYLTKSELLRALLEGMVRPPHPYVVKDCLDAVRLYSKGARMDPRPTNPYRCHRRTQEKSERTQSLRRC